MIMLLIVRIITIIVSIAWLAIGIFLIVAGLQENPTDTEAVWLGVGVILFYLANLYLLYRSYRKKHAPTHWVAFLFSIIPALAIWATVWILNAADRF